MAPGETFLTYFDGAHSLSLSYPATWRTDQATQDGVWYRYFLGAPAGSQRNPGVSVTLLVGSLTSSIEDYAQVYLAGNAPASSKDEQRQGARGRSYSFSSAGGQKRHRLLLLEEAGSVYGLYAQGDAEPFERQGPLVERMFASLNLERPASYPEQRDARFAYALRLPPSWQQGRRLVSGDRLAAQHLSPPLAADRDGRTVHASLTVSVDRLGAAGSLDDYYRATRTLLGQSFQILDHVRWRDGYADVMKTETPLATSRLRRYYRVADGRGYSLLFEAREDVFQDVVAWFELIAGTFRIGSELTR